jgi:hypothetical protein
MSPLQLSLMDNRNNLEQDAKAILDMMENIHQVAISAKDKIKLLKESISLKTSL